MNEHVFAIENKKSNFRSQNPDLDWLKGMQPKWMVRLSQGVCDSPSLPPLNQINMKLIGWSQWVNR